MPRGGQWHDTGEAEVTQLSAVWWSLKPSEVFMGLSLAGLRWDGCCFHALFTSTLRTSTPKQRTKQISTRTNIISSSQAKLRQSAHSSF